MDVLLKHSKITISPYSDTGNLGYEGISASTITRYKGSAMRIMFGNAYTNIPTLAFYPCNAMATRLNDRRKTLGVLLDTVAPSAHMVCWAMGMTSNLRVTNTVAPGDVLVPTSTWPGVAKACTTGDRNKGLGFAMADDTKSTTPVAAIRAIILPWRY